LLIKKKRQGIGQLHFRGLSVIVWAVRTRY